MQTLFISFTGTLHALARGEVTPDHLATGLFYFGCIREHAFDPGNPAHECDERKWIDQNNPNKGAEVHLQLVDALYKAEAEGRVKWYDKNKNRYQQLNALLVENGFPALTLTPANSWNYNYPAVIQIVDQQLSGQLKVCGS